MPSKLACRCPGIRLRHLVWAQRDEIAKMVRRLLLDSPGNAAAAAIGMQEVGKPALGLPAGPILALSKQTGRLKSDERGHLAR